MMALYILVALAIAISATTSIAVVVAMIGRLLGFTFDDNWRICRYKTLFRKNEHKKRIRFGKVGKYERRD